MATVTKTASVTKAFGKNLSEYGNVPAELNVDYSYEALGSVSEIPDSEKLSDDDILAVINARRNAAARAKAVNEKLAEFDIKPPAMSTEEKAVNALVKGLQLLGHTEAEARAMAESMLAAKK